MPRFPLVLVFFCFPFSLFAQEAKEVIEPTFSNERERFRPFAEGLGRVIFFPFLAFTSKAPSNEQFLSAASTSTELDEATKAWTISIDFDPASTEWQEQRLFLASKSRLSKKLDNVQEIFGGPTNAVDQVRSSDRFPNPVLMVYIPYPLLNWDGDSNFEGAPRHDAEGVIGVRMYSSAESRNETTQSRMVMLTRDWALRKQEFEVDFGVYQSYHGNPPTNDPKLAQDFHSDFIKPLRKKRTDSPGFRSDWILDSDEDFPSVYMRHYAKNSARAENGLFLPIYLNGDAWGGVSENYSFSICVDVFLFDSNFDRAYKLFEKVKISR